MRQSAARSGIWLYINAVEHRLRPILGFGLAGCLLLPIAIALAYCAAGGLDLRHALLELLYNAQGERFVFHVIIRRVLFASYWASLVGVVCGPITLLSVLIAMHLAPRQWKWWAWAGIPAWLLLNPWLCLQIATMCDPHIPSAVSFLASRSRPVQFVGDALWVVMLQLAALALFVRAVVSSAGKDAPRTTWRFVPLVLFGIGTALAMLAALSDRQPAPWFTFEGHVALGVLWHSSVAFSLIGAAIHARRAVTAQHWRCVGCGYDLRGLSSRESRDTICPECGQMPQAELPGAK